MTFAMLPPRDQLVTIMQRIYHGRMTTLSGGNLSIRDDDGSLWITPAGIDKGRLTPNDIIHVHADGRCEGPHRPSSELPFHRAIYASRPDLRAIVHAHPPALVAFSIARVAPSTALIPHARAVCGAVRYAPYARPGSEQLGAAIAATFAHGSDVVMLENHGVVAGGADLLTAFQRLETLDFCARIQILAQRLGGVVSLSDAQIALFDRLPQAQGTFTPGPASSRERELRLQLCDFVARACDRQLMISTEGVISARLDADRFVITPTGFDRRDLTPGDIVLIDGGRAEAGKLPSRSVNLHHAIYQRHADIGAIMTAQTPAATAYAVSTTHFDTRGIPESYVLLRDVPRVLYGQPYTAPERVAEVISTRAPVLLMQNDGVMTAGRTVLEAFDRLEVAEYSARALIDIEAIGALVPIGPKELEDLRTAYALD